MIIIVAIFSLTLVLWFAGRRSSAPAATGMQIKPLRTHSNKALFTVGVYNIHRARGADGKKDIKRIANVIKNADIIGLCEVQGWANIRGDNQVSLLASECLLAGLFCPTQKRWLHYDRGNGMLSRFVIEKWQRKPLIDTVGRHARCLCRVDIVIDHAIVPVFITHVARRVDQERQLQAVFDEFGQHDIAILMGDFNVNADFEFLQNLIKQYDAQDALATIEHENRIDWIVVKGLKVVNAQVDDNIASDHPYYWCQLSLIDQ